MVLIGAAHGLVLLPVLLSYFGTNFFLLVASDNPSRRFDLNSQGKIFSFLLIDPRLFQDVRELFDRTWELRVGEWNYSPGHSFTIHLSFGINQLPFSLWPGSFSSSAAHLSTLPCTSLGQMNALEALRSARRFIVTTRTQNIAVHFSAGRTWGTEGPCRKRVIGLKNSRVEMGRSIRTVPKLFYVSAQYLQCVPYILKCFKINFAFSGPRINPSRARRLQASLSKAKSER